MDRKKKSGSPGAPGSTPRSVTDEALSESDPGKLFNDDGSKAEDIERVGAMAPDSDPVESEPPERAAPRRPPPRNEQ